MEKKQNYFSENIVEELEGMNYNNGSKERTYIANAIELAGDKAKYDAQVKRILADKNILAWILKFSAKEFKNSSIEEIKTSIEGTPEISKVPVYPGKAVPEAITGQANNDKVPNEGEITYDIKFYAITSGKERIKLIINVEAQKKYHAGYDLVTRGIFYGARLLSAQLDTEFTGKDYDQIKKVYSIWICMDTPEYAANTLTEYRVEQNRVYGDFDGKARYDLLSVVMICLGKEENSGQEVSKIHGLLSTLLSEKLTSEEKEDILSNQYGIVTTTEMKEEMRLMCNLSDLIEERGIEQGIERGIEQGIERGIEQGIERGITQGIQALIETCKELGLSKENTQEKVQKKFAITQEKAEVFMGKYWK